MGDGDERGRHSVACTHRYTVTYTDTDMGRETDTATKKKPLPPRRSLPDLFKAWAISAGVEGNNGKVDGAFAQGHVRDSAGGWVVVCSCHSG